MYDDILGKEVELVDIELNFKLGEKTVNGRIYDKDKLLNEFDKKIEKNNGILITLESPINEIVPLDKIIGIAKSYEVLDNTIIFKVYKIHNVFDSVKYLTLSGLGNVSDSKVIDYNLICLYIIKNNNKSDR